MDIDTYNEFISDLCDWIEAHQARLQMWPGYVNDPIDTDMEMCFL